MRTRPTLRGDLQFRLQRLHTVLRHQAGHGPTDQLFGGAGADRLHGGAGPDRLRGGAGGDRLLGGAGGDRLSGGGGRDLIKGAGGVDLLSGGAGGDRLLGGRGADRLDGGPRTDVLFGGPGADVFLLGRKDGRDRIKDFRPGVDRIEVEGASGWDALRVERRGDDALVKHRDASLRLEDVDAAELDPDDFLFV